MQNLIKTQYNVEATISANASPLTLGSDNVRQSPQDYDLIRLLQRQIHVLQQEIRRLHNRHRELYSEIERLKSTR
jgi:uncharacterized small protein (DUF1192 family)